MPEPSLFTKEKGSIFNAKDSMMLLVKRIHNVVATEIESGFWGGFYMEFNNKVVIVTGGAQGIGKTIAEELPL